MSHQHGPDLSLRRYGPSRGSHSHDHFQILWSLEGSLELEIDGAGTRVSAGSGCLIAPGERHDFESRAGSRCLVLDTPDSDWATRLRRPRFARAADHLVHCLAEAIEGGAEFSADYGAFLLAQLWGGADGVQRPRREIDWPRLTRWVRARLSLPLTAADLARQASLGESQFRARCLLVQGCAPMQWVRRLRLEKAQMLRASGMGAGEVASRVGYESATALAAAMRRSVPG
jgi:AraC-like DNA-binding protein